MASTANPFSISLSSKPTAASLFNPTNPSELSLRVRSPGLAALRSSNCSSSVKLSPARSKAKIMVSSAQLVDQPPSKTAPTVVDVDLGNRSYPIYIGSGLLNQPELLQRLFIYEISLLHWVIGEGDDTASYLSFRQMREVDDGGGGWRQMRVESRRVRSPER